MLKFETLEIENHSISTRNYAVPYYQTIKEIPWPLSLENLREGPKFSKNLKKIAKFITILRV